MIQGSTRGATTASPTQNAKLEKKKVPAKTKLQKSVKKQDSMQAKKATAVQAKKDKKALKMGHTPPLIPAQKGTFVITPANHGTVGQVDGPGQQAGTMVRHATRCPLTLICTHT